MAQAYTPGLTVTGKATIRKTRRLPLTGTVVVKVGDHVTSDQVIARTDLPGKVFPVNFANELGVMAEEVPDVLRKKAGEAITKGEVLAEKKAFFGFIKTDFKSPINGTVESISKITGQVILREPPVPVEVKAYIDGIVIEEIPREGVVIEAEGALIQGIFGLAGEVHAPIVKLARSPDEVIDEEKITEALKGKVVIGGALLTRGALKKCADLGVAAFVTGGFRYNDVKEILGYDVGVAITGHEKLGTTLVVTEGFGKIAMARATYDLLCAHEGKIASANGATQIRAGVIRPEVIIPLTAAQIVETAGAVDLGLDVGAPVRGIRAPYFGRIGKVTAMPHELMKMPSETKVRVLEVEFEDTHERVLCPRANVETIERR
jgi:hypothetical protein